MYLFNPRYNNNRYSNNSNNNKINNDNNNNYYSIKPLQLVNSTNLTCLI